MKLFGLIGFPLKHSFSKKYFTEKFEKENISNHHYELFELPDFNDLPTLITQNPDLVGLNVTIPHKQNVLPFMNDLDQHSAARIGAVNTIKIMPNGLLKGYNTDYYGFKTSLEQWLPTTQNIQALVLGNGGAAKAVCAALADLQIDYQIVSRNKTLPDIRTYDELDERIIATHRLIINTSPVGTFPNVNYCPDIPYNYLTDNHFLYDLVYNPTQTLFLQKGESQGAATHNGLAMLHLQAEKAWEIWNEEVGN